MTPAEADGLLFDGTTHCDEDLPVNWSAVATAASSQDRNATVLRLVSQIEEPLHEAHDNKGKAPETDSTRLEAKVDLLMHLVGTLVALHKPPPPVAGLTLSCRGLVWRNAPASLEIGTTGRVSIHVHPAVPLPLEIGASVVAVDRETSPPRAWLKFDPLCEGLAAALERFTFRRHRRAVADLRQARSVSEAA